MEIGKNCTKISMRKCHIGFDMFTVVKTAIRLEYNIIRTLFIRRGIFQTLEMIESRRKQLNRAMVPHLAGPQ